MSEIHLVCNAHLDPVWQWEWEEGAAAAVSTFRAAADFCEEFDDFVFCHNEALLYRWVEEYEPKLFARIQKLVKAGKWHICGGWYLQPDCNMPSGESIIHQMRQGRRYFMEKFGAYPTTAISFDAFGHNRGLAQLLKKAGYDSYLFMRPNESDCHLPASDFLWVGYDGSEVMGHRLTTGYNSALGGAADKLRDWLRDHPDAELGLVTWGVGNHGGGPSRQDINAINELKASCPEKGIRHSLPEQYFAKLAEKRDTLPRFADTIGPWAVGCYTSQIRIKQQHRRLENLLAQTERMLSVAAMQGLVKYPEAELDEVARDLCLSEFHDSLPGTCIQPVEEQLLNTLGHGQETLNRLRARAFFALASDEKPAAPGEYPILVYNPFPYPVEQEVACEFMLADQNWKDEFTDITVWRDGVQLPAQVEKERSNLTLDWRKRVVFRATLAPMQMNRFDCRTNILPGKPRPTCAGTDEAFTFDNGRLYAQISKTTGLLRSYQVDGYEYLADEAMKLLVVNDDADPWGMNVNRFREVIGAFELMNPEQSARFAGVDAETLPAVRVIEDGEVRTVIEASFTYKDSRALVTYRLPKSGTAVEIGLRLQCAEKDRMFKLSIPTVCRERYIGQGMFGFGELKSDGMEVVAQEWTATQGNGHTVSFINDGVYGSDCVDGEIHTSVLRSAGYTVHPINDRELVPQDRFTPRIDQGERLYNFRLEGGETADRLAKVNREAQLFNEVPYGLSFFPSGEGKKPQAAVTLTGEGVVLSAMRPAQDGKGMIVRLFEGTGEDREAELTIAQYGVKKHVALKPFEVRTLRVQTDGSVTETNILD